MPTYLPPAPVADYESFHYYKKQLIRHLDRAKQIEFDLELTKTHPWWQRLWVLPTTLFSLRELDMLRNYCYLLRVCLEGYNERSGLPRRLPDLPTYWPPSAYDTTPCL